MLRDYQHELVERIEEAHGRVRSVLLQLPTGGGKTHIATEIVRRSREKGERVWFVCHRREIINQTIRGLDRACIPAGVIGMGREREHDATVQVCSVATLARMTDTLPPPDRIIWDEAHHLPAGTWAKVKDRHEQAQHLGLTATPIRLDGRGLGDHFEDMVCGPTMSELREMGFLKPYRAFVPSIPDLRKVGYQAGDWKRGELEKRMTASGLVGDIVEHAKRLPSGSRTILFAVSVKAAENYVGRLFVAGIKSALVTSKTPEHERDAAIADLAAGRISILANVEIFTEGFDLPEIDAVILARPTISFGLYLQMVGRGLRPTWGEDDLPVQGRRLIIHDHAGLIYTHGLPDETAQWDLRAKRDRKILDAERLRRCPDCSSTYKFASTCPECGYEHQAYEKDLREESVQLLELPDSTFSRPPGNVSQARFARDTGRTTSAVNRYVSRGLPCAIDGSINPVEAEAWISNNTKKSPRRNVSQSQFARDTSRARSTIVYYAGRGMPTAEDGSLNPIEAEAWIVNYLSMRPIGNCTRKQFAERTGRTRGMLNYYIKRGMPCAKDGSINPDQAEKWISENVKMLSKDKMTQSQFARSTGRPFGLIQSFIKRGMPCAEYGSVDVAAAETWIAANAHKHRTRKASRDQPT